MPERPEPHPKPLAQASRALRPVSVSSTVVATTPVQQQQEGIRGIFPPHGSPRLMVTFGLQEVSDISGTCLTGECLERRLASGYLREPPSTLTPQMYRIMRRALMSGGTRAR